MSEHLLDLVVTPNMFTLLLAFGGARADDCRRISDHAAGMALQLAADR